MFLVGIAGGSGSGKTTFAHRVLQGISHSAAGILHQDSYYLPRPPGHLEMPGGPNFDHPEAFDWELIRDHLTMLKRGERVPVPVYDYASNARHPTEVEWLGPCRAVLFEGIFALWDDHLRDLLDLKIFLHVDADIRLIRRLHRDIQERGRTVDGVIRQYYDTVRPMHRIYLEPTRQYADIIIGEETESAADVVAAKIKERLI